MKKRNFKERLGDLMLLGFLICTVYTLMFAFIYSYNGIDGTEVKCILILITFVILFLTGFIFSIDRKR
ncbi:MAG: hypothetical protein UIT70_07170 [Clostridia bacterium]|nr:hypothetical protein [Clostridia bacterium]